MRSYINKDITDTKIAGQSVGSDFIYRIYACDNDYDWQEADDRTRGASPEQSIEFLKAPSIAYSYPNPAPDANVKIGIYDISGHLGAIWRIKLKAGHTTKKIGISPT